MVNASTELTIGNPEYLPNDFELYISSPGATTSGFIIPFSEGPFDEYDATLGLVYFIFSFKTKNGIAAELEHYKQNDLKK